MRPLLVLGRSPFAYLFPFGSEMVRAVEGAGVVRVAVVSPQEVVRRGLASMLQDYPDRVAVSTAPFASCLEGEVDVIVYDTFGLFLRDGAELAQLNEANAKVLVFSRDLRPDLRAQAFKIGARAWISMSAHAAELVHSIELTARGIPIGESLRELQGTADGLTARELEVLGLIAQGLSNQDIAEKLAMSGNTLKSHIRRAYGKIGVTSRSQAVSWAMAHGLNSG